MWKLILFMGLSKASKQGQQLPTPLKIVVEVLLDGTNIWFSASSYLHVILYLCYFLVIFWEIFLITRHSLHTFFSVLYFVLFSLPTPTQPGLVPCNR